MFFFFFQKEKKSSRLVRYVCMYVCMYVHVSGYHVYRLESVEVFIVVTVDVVR